MPLSITLYTVCPSVKPVPLTVYPRAIPVVSVTPSIPVPPSHETKFVEITILLAALLLPIAIISVPILPSPAFVPRCTFAFSTLKFIKLPTLVIFGCALVITVPAKLA